MKSTLATLTAIGAILAFGTAAKAESIAALIGDAAIAIVDGDTLAAGPATPVTGIDGALVGIDVRASDGKLYGLVANGTVVTIDPVTGAATTVVKLDTVPAAGAAITVDFNPAADRLRIISADGTNLRANLADGKVTTDGKLAFAEADMHKGETPNIVAGAYTNNVAGTKETALYDVDATIGALIKQAPPNDGVLSAVGKFGVTADRYAFDILTAADGTNTAYLMAGDTLHTVDLATGAATPAGAVTGLTGAVTDIAALPGT